MKPAVYTPADLAQVATPEQAQPKESSFNMSFITEINKGISGLNSLLVNFQKAKGLVGGLTGTPEPQDTQHIQTKIEKGVDQRMKQAQSSIEPQREPKIAVHVGNATKEFIGFTDVIFGSIDENKTIAEAKEELKNNMSEELIAPMVQNFLEKHTEVYLE